MRNREIVLFATPDGYKLIDMDGKLGVKNRKGEFIREKDMKAFLEKPEIKAKFIEQYGFVPKFKFEEVKK